MFFYLYYFQILSGSETTLLYLIILANNKLERTYSAFVPFPQFFFICKKNPIFTNIGLKKPTCEALLVYMVKGSSLLTCV